MAIRAVLLYGLVSLVWALLCFAGLMTLGFNLLLSTSGAVVGLIYGGIAADRHLRAVEKKGESKASRKMWVFILLAIVVIVLLMLYFAFSFGLSGVNLILSFGYPFVPAVYLAMTGLYLNWERTQKKLVWLEGAWVGRLYASQKPEKT